MKFNTIIKNSIAVSSIALIATACKPSMIEDEPALFALASTQIRGLAAGNCAISLNLGTLYSGAIIQTAVKSMTQAEYEAATSTTVGTGQTYETWASVPYNVKYDAFIRGGGTFTADSRKTKIDTAKATVVGSGILGSVVASCTANNALTGAQLQGLVTGLYNGLPEADQTAANTFFSQFATALGGTGTTESFATNLSTKNCGDFASGNGSTGAVYANVLKASVDSGGTASFNGATSLGGNPAAAPTAGAPATGTSLLSCFYAGTSDPTSLVGCSNITLTYANVCDGTDDNLTPGQCAVKSFFGALGSAYQATQAYSNGTAILACARIPSSSCNMGAITTGSRSGAIASGEATYNAIANNQECRKTDANFMNKVRTALFAGTPKGTKVLGVDANPNGTFGAISEGGEFKDNKIFPETAYPTSSALSNISADFNVAFPLSTGTVAQGSSTIPHYKASNIAVAKVASCESLGFGNLGPINTAPADATALGSRKPLTGVAEIAYAFSPGNTAATTYAAVRGTSTTDPTPANDGVACNNSFRDKFEIPLAIGGGKLPKLEGATSGDGGASALLTTCLYGGTAAGRSTSASLLGTTSLTGISDCDAKGSGGAAKFGDTGLNTLSAFPNNAAAE